MLVDILLADGFEETEAVVPCDLLRRAGANVRLIGVNGIRIVSSHLITVTADAVLESHTGDLPDLLVLPGGRRGVDNLLASEAALDLVRRAWAAGKYVAAICAAPTILAHLGVTDGRSAVCYPGMEPRMGNAELKHLPVVTDGRLITGRAAGSSMAFGLALVEALFGPDAAQRVADGVVYTRA